MNTILVRLNKQVWRLLMVVVLCLTTDAGVAQEGVRLIKYMVIVDTSPSMFQKPDSPLALNWKEPAMVEVQRQLGDFVANLPDGTEVDLASFDTAYRHGTSTIVRSQTERIAARRYFASLRSVGGLTHLWASMDVALEQASGWLATHPGGTIRILFYTDGTDTEELGSGGVKRDPQVILAKYSEVLKNQVKFNLVTIGFELKSDVREKLEAGHVTVTKAIATQQNLIPLESAFRLSTSQPIVGDVVRLDDDSQGVGIVKRETHWGDGSIDSEPTHIYASPGEFMVRHVVTTQSRQTAVSSQRVVVAKPEVKVPPKLEAAFEVVLDHVLLGEDVQVIDESISDGEVTRAFRLDGKLISSDRNPRFQPENAGSYVVELELRDQHGQVSRASKKVVVDLPAAPTAQFRLVKSQITVGETAQVIDESVGAETWSWRTSVGHNAKVRNPSFEFDTAGDVDFFLEVTDRYGQTAKATAKLVVVRHAAPKLDFFAPDTLLADAKLEVVNRSSGLIDSQQWIVDGQLISTERDLRLDTLTVGEHELELVASGPGGQSRLAKRFVVAPFPQPVADFTIGTERPFVGDTVVFTDTSIGKVDRIEWWFGTSTEPVIIDYAAGSVERSVSYALASSGPLTVRSNAYGPGGASTSERTINVATRTKAPKTRIEADNTSGRGKLAVRFLNQSEGTIYKTIVDFGDGSEKLELEGSEGGNHVYGPGEFVAKFTSVGPEEFGTSSDMIDISVAKPIPSWVWHSLWATPLGLCMLFVGGLIARNRWDYQLLSEAAKLSGTFSFKSNAEIGTPFEVVSLDGNSDEVELQLRDGHTAVLRSLIDDEGVHFHVTINEKGNEFIGTLVAGEDQNVGSYVVNYVQ